MMMSRVVAEVAGQQVVDRAHVVVGSFEVIIYIQSGMMGICHPGSEEQTADHRQDKTE